METVEKLSTELIRLQVSHQTEIFFLNWKRKPRPPPYSFWIHQFFYNLIGQILTVIFPPPKEGHIAAKAC